MLSGDEPADNAQGFIQTNALYKATRQLNKAKEFEHSIIRKGQLHCTNQFYMKAKCVEGQMVPGVQISSLLSKEDHQREPPASLLIHKVVQPGVTFGWLWIFHRRKGWGTARHLCREERREEGKKVEMEGGREQTSKLAFSDVSWLTAKQHVYAVVSSRLSFKYNYGLLETCSAGLTMIVFIRPEEKETESSQQMTSAQWKKFRRSPTLEQYGLYQPLTDTIL